MQDLSERPNKNHDDQSCLLIVDDDYFLRASLCQQLNAEGFQNVVNTGVEPGLRKILEDTKPDLILLDLQLPNSSSAMLCKHLRNEGFTVPILFMIAKNTEFEFIDGFQADADDYIKKPIRVNELLERIYRQLRQFKVSDDVSFEIADLNFFPTNKKLQKTGCEQSQALTEKETTILKFLYSVFPESVTKDEILAEVWGLQNGLTTHTLETHIYRLRQKIGQLTKTPLVITTDSGYRLRL